MPTVRVLRVSIQAAAVKGRSELVITPSGAPESSKAGHLIRLVNR